MSRIRPGDSVTFDNGKDTTSGRVSDINDGMARVVLNNGSAKWKDINVLTVTFRSSRSLVSNSSLARIGPLIDRSRDEEEEGSEQGTFLGGETLNNRSVLQLHKNMRVTKLRDDLAKKFSLEKPKQTRPDSVNSASRSKNSTDSGKHDSAYGVSAGSPHLHALHNNRKNGAKDKALSVRVEEVEDVMAALDEKMETLTSAVKRQSAKSQSSITSQQGSMFELELLVTELTARCDASDRRIKTLETALVEGLKESAGARFAKTAPSATFSSPPQLIASKQLAGSVNTTDDGSASEPAATLALGDGQEDNGISGGNVSAGSKLDKHVSFHKTAVMPAEKSVKPAVSRTAVAARRSSQSPASPADRNARKRIPASSNSADSPRVSRSPRNAATARSPNIAVTRRRNKVAAGDRPAKGNKKVRAGPMPSINNIDINQPLDLARLIVAHRWFERLKKCEANADWKTRKGLLEELRGLLDVEALAGVGYDELALRLTTIGVNDANPTVSGLALACVGRLAMLLGGNFGGTAHQMLPDLLDLLKEKKVSIDRENQALLDIILQHTITIGDTQFVSTIRKALKHKVLKVREDSMALLERSVPNQDPDAIAAFAEDMAEELLRLLEAPSSRVRASAAATIGQMHLQLPDDTMLRYLQAVDDAQYKKICTAIGIDDLENFHTTNTLGGDESSHAEPVSEIYPEQRVIQETQSTNSEPEPEHRNVQAVTPMQAHRLQPAAAGLPTRSPATAPTGGERVSRNDNKRAAGRGARSKGRGQGRGRGRRASGGNSKIETTGLTPMQEERQRAKEEAAERRKEEETAAKAKRAKAKADRQRQRGYLMKFNKISDGGEKNPTVSFEALAKHLGITDAEAMDAPRFDPAVKAFTMNDFMNFMESRHKATSEI